MIFAFVTFVANTPFWRKNASKVWKNIFQISHLTFLDATGGQIFDLWLYFHFLFLHLIQAQLGPFSFIWNIWMQKNEGQGWNFRVKYLDVEKIYDIAMHYAARAMGAMSLRISELCLSFSPHPNIWDWNFYFVHHFFASKYSR